jgi:hypothetical protein
MTRKDQNSLTSLYLGDGPLETALVDELVRGQAAAAAATCSAPRQLLCLLDYHRARRPGALLLPAKLSRAPGGRVCLLASPSAPRAASGAAWGAGAYAGVSPWADSANTTLLPTVTAVVPAGVSPSAGDATVMAMNYRLCLTNNAVEHA